MNRILNAFTATSREPFCLICLLAVVSCSQSKSAGRASAQLGGGVDRAISLFDRECPPFMRFVDGSHSVDGRYTEVPRRDASWMRQAEETSTTFMTNEGEVLAFTDYAMSADDVSYAFETLDRQMTIENEVCHLDDEKCSTIHSLWRDYFMGEVVPRFANRRVSTAELLSRDPEKECGGWELLWLKQWSDSVRVDSKHQRIDAMGRLRDRSGRFRTREARHIAWLWMVSIGIVSEVEYSELVADAREAWRTCSDWKKHQIARRLSWILPVEMPHLEGYRDNRTLLAYQQGALTLMDDLKVFLDDLKNFHGGCLLRGEKVVRSADSVATD